MWALDFNLKKLEHTLNLLQFHLRKYKGVYGLEIFNYHKHVENISKRTTVCHQTTQECQDKTIDSVLDFSFRFHE